MPGFVSITELMESPCSSRDYHRRMLLFQIAQYIDV